MKIGYTIKPDRPLAQEVVRIGSEQVILMRSSLSHLLELPEKIHDIRVASKRLRALARLIRPGCMVTAQCLNDHARDTAKLLSMRRDRDVVLSTLHWLDRIATSEEADALGILRQQFMYQDATVPDSSLKTSIAETLGAISQCLRNMDCSELTEKSLLLMLKRDYQRCRKQFRHIDEMSSAAQWHSLRKRVKTHTYQFELLHHYSGKDGHKRLKKLKRLGDRLGDYHDLDVLNRVITEWQERPALSQAVNLVTNLIEEQQQKLARKIFKQGNKWLSGKFSSLEFGSSAA